MKNFKFSFHLLIAFAFYPTQLVVGTPSANAETQCTAVASKDTTAVARDEGMMISACEYRSDCKLKEGTKLLVRSIVVLPSYDMHNMFLQGEDGACFMSRDFDFNEECDAPVKVGEGCEP